MDPCDGKVGRVHNPESGRHVYPVEESFDYRLLFETSAEGVLIVTADGDVLDANREARGILRKRWEDIRAAGCDGLFDPSDPRLRHAMEERERTGQFRGELRLLRRGGEPFAAEVSIADAGEGVAGIFFRDVTGRRQVEEELRKSEERYRNIFEKAVEGIFQTTAEEELLMANPAMAQMLGYESPEELVATISNVAEQLFVEATLRSEFSDLTRRHGAVSGFEVEAYRKDGSTVWVSVSVWDVYDAGGRLVGYDGTLEDITERRRTQEALRGAEEMFRATFDLATVGIAHVGLDGRWLRVNRRLSEIVGYPEEELLTKTFQDITYPEDLEVELDYVRRMLSGKIETYSIEKRYVKKDGSIVWVYLTVSLTRGGPAGARDYFVLFVEDIDERKRAERLLLALTPRERKILGLLAQGCTNREIAQEMNFSEGTVKIHVRRIMVKLGAPGRIRTAVRAAELGVHRPTGEAER